MIEVYLQPDHNTDLKKICGAGIFIVLLEGYRGYDVPGDVLRLLGEGGLKVMKNCLTQYMKLESGLRTLQKLQ